MHQFRNHSLRFKLSLATLLATGLTLLIALSAIVAIEYTAGRRALEQQLMTTGEMLARNIRSALVFDDVKFAERILQNLSVQQNIQDATIYRNDQSIFATYRRHQNSGSAVDSRPSGAESNLVQVSRPIILDGEHAGSIALSSDLDEVHQRTAIFALISLLVMLVSLLVAYLLWSRLLRVITRPVNRLVDIVNRVTREKNYALRAKTHGNDELGQLVTGFNRMLEQVQIRDRELWESRELLEKKVTDRTSSLKAAKEAAESADRAKSAFVANISHEIRTPLNAVLGLTELALKSNPSPTLLEYLNKIQSAGNSLHEIISDVLDMSRIEAGGLELEKLPFDLAHVRQKVIDMLSLKASEKGLEFTFSIDDDVPAMLYGDPLRLSQVLLNLANNAIKFTDSGRVAIKVGHRSTTDGYTELQFRVSDTGIGIDTERLAQIFEPFTQADDSHTRLYGGSGLGLSISKWLVGKMDGRMQVESRVGQGSTFSFTARFGQVEKPQPAVARKQVTPSLVDIERQSRGSIDRQILVVEDNPINRQIVVETLDSVGYQVTVAGNGAQALEVIRHNTFDVVLMDIQMPVMDGFEATRHIRADLGLDDLPIIAMTAHSRDDMRNACREAGIDDILTKPVDSMTLIDLILAHTGDSQPPKPFAEPTQKEAPDGKTLPAALPGIDIVSALRRVSGKQDVLRQLYQDFYLSQSGMAAEIAQAYASDDISRALEMLHRLRGVAANLGATELADAAAMYETAIAEGLPVDTAQSRFTGRFDEVMHGLREHLVRKHAADNQDSIFDPDQLLAGLAELRDLLASGSFQATDKLEQVRSSLGGRCATIYAHLAKCIREYRYEDAEASRVALIECIKQQAEA